MSKWLLYGANGYTGRLMAEYAVQQGHTIKFHILIDRESVEVFVDDGRLVLTELIFPAESSSGIELFAEGGEGKLKSLTAYRFATAESAD